MKINKTVLSNLKSYFKIKVIKSTDVNIYHL